MKNRAGWKDLFLLDLWKLSKVHQKNFFRFFEAFSLLHWVFQFKRVLLSTKYFSRITFLLQNCFRRFFDFGLHSLEILEMEYDICWGRIYHFLFDCVRNLLFWWLNLKPGFALFHFEAASFCIKPREWETLYLNKSSRSRFLPISQL